LICPNHVCDVDPPAVAGALPRKSRFIAKHELFEMRILTWVLPMFGAFPIRRDTADRAAVKTAISHLKAGEAVVVFPEGGGNPDGVLQPLQAGALMMAVQAGVPVIPCALIHTNRVLPYGGTRLQRSPEPVMVIFGEPIEVSEFGTGKAGVEAATRILTERLAAMLKQPVPEGPHVPHALRGGQR
jgi:1-acyl-sn-glycerol-3-phosphate acyltransferase